MCASKTMYLILPNMNSLVCFKYDYVTQWAVDGDHLQRDPDVNKNTVLSLRFDS